MRQLFVTLILAVLVSFSLNAQAISENAVKTESVVSLADKIAKSDPSIERRACPKSGSVSYFKKQVCEKSGKVSYNEVQFDASSEKFQLVGAAIDEKPQAKAKCQKGNGKKCCKKDGAKSCNKSVSSDSVNGKKCCKKDAKKCSKSKASTKS